MINKRQEARELERKSVLCHKAMLHDDAVDWELLDRAAESVFRDMAILNNVALTDDSWIGRTYVEPRGDGQAFYVVVDVVEDKLVFAHMPIGEALMSPMLERGKLKASFDDVWFRLARWTVYVPRTGKPMSNDEFLEWEKGVKTSENFD